MEYVTISVKSMVVLIPRARVACSLDMVEDIIENVYPCLPIGSMLVELDDLTQVERTSSTLLIEHV